MAEVKQVARPKQENEVVVERAKDFWSQYSKPITIGLGALILLLAGWFGYKKFVKEPNEIKANEAIFKAEDHFLLRDSLTAGTASELARVADKYDGTKAGNRAKFLAGAAYLRLEDHKNAEKYLKGVDLESKMVQAKAYNLLGHAYAGQGKNREALDAYKKAGHHFTADDVNSPEYLFNAAFLAHKVLNDKEEAIKLYREIRKSYPNTAPGFEATKFLAQLGVYETEE